MSPGFWKFPFRVLLWGICFCHDQKGSPMWDNCLSLGHTGFLWVLPWTLVPWTTVPWSLV